MGGAGNIICIGAVNLDRTYRVENVVKEGEAMNCRGYEESWGGKGLNQVVALRCAGEHPIFITKVGQREESSLRELLASKGVDDSHIVPVNGYTNHGVIQMTPQGRTAIIGVPNDEVSFTPEEIGALMEGISWEDTLLLQNEIAHVPAIIRLAKEKGCTVVLNPSPLCDGMREWPLEEVDILILNEAEGQALSGEMLVEEILAALHRRCPKSRIVLTLGERGSIFSNGVERIEQPSVPAEAVDTLAAGDTFTGYFLAVYEKTGDAAAALETAAMAASMVVGRRGAAEIIPVMEEVTGRSLLYN